MEVKPKIVIACDSFKGSLTSVEAGCAVADGIHDIFPDAETIVIPIADGGEGTMNAVISGTGGTAIECMVHDPLKRPIKAYYGICGDTAVVEMAQASGITLLRDAERDPLTTTTYGTGELIADALKRGCRSFLIGIGGSATNDGGIGMLKALGYRFLDSSGNMIPDAVTDLNKITGIDDSNVADGLRESNFTVACDVRNPLTGTDGASAIFGPQKGATPEMIKILDCALTNFAKATANFTGKDYSATPGSGAGGGIGFAFLAYLNGKLKPGIEMVLDAVDFTNKIHGASFVITGEGRIDRQTCMGKAPIGILRRAQAQVIPVITIGGTVDKDALRLLTSAGFHSVCEATPAGMNLAEAMIPAVAKANIRSAIKNWLVMKNGD